MSSEFIIDAVDQLDEPRSSGTVSLVATADLPSRFGDFKIAAFIERETGKEHSAIFRGELTGASNVPCRIHSECHTGDVLGSLRCDCRSQLEKALTYIGAQPVGLVLYLRQEGRGIGLANKIKAYRLQELGLDTVEANEALGLPAEARDYTVAADMLRLLGPESIRLLSNNPHKFESLERQGIEVAGRLPVITEVNSHNRRYLETKVRKMGHDLNGSIKAVGIRVKKIL